MRASFILTLAAASLATACSQESKSPETQTTAADDAAPLGKLSDEVIPVAYRLDLTIDPDQETFQGTVEIDVEAEQALSRIWLHGDALEMGNVYAVLADGTQVNASYEQVDVTGVSRLSFDSTLPEGALTLHAEYSAPFAVSPDGLYHTEEGDLYYVASQLESIAARKVFPSFDEPRFKTPYDITVTTKTGDAAISISPELSAEDLGNGYTRHVFETTKPVPSYLLAFAVGPYDINEWTPMPPNDVRDVPTPLRGIASRGKGERMDYALENTIEMVRLLEEYFDTPYPYEKLDLIAPPDFFGGAMENVAAIMYNEYLMLMDENSAFSQRRIYEIVHAHELAHQWFGNYVTPAWWDDIWLNESFASWMENKIAEQHWPEGEFSRATLNAGLGAMAADSLANARQIRNDVNTNAEIDDAFDTITYEKGGAVLDMFESYLGPDAFREGVRTHMRRFAHGTATVEDFMQSMADGSGRQEVIPAIRSFISQPGVPLVEATLDCEDAPVLKLRQSRYAPLGSAINTNQTWQIPFCAAYGTEDGQQTACALIDTKEKELQLETQSCPAFVVPNGDGSGYFRFALDDAGWAALAEVAESLTPEQALAYADSLDAAFRSNAASADALLDGFVALTHHPSWDVVSAVADKYEVLIDIAPNDEARGQLEGFARQTFRPIYDALGGSNDPQAQLLRRNLTRFMAIVAIDPDVRSEMLPGARAFVGLNGEPDPDAISPDLAETILSVGVQEDGAPFFDALLALVRASDDPALRNFGLGALARTEDPDLSLRLLNAILAEEFSRSEMGGVIFRQTARIKTQDIAWQWVQDNFDKLRERSSGLTGLRGFISIGGLFCSAEKVDDYKAFILSHAEDLPGYERTMAQSVEAIELCDALMSTKGQEFVDAANDRL